MGRKIDFYFTMISPWVYIGDQVFNNLVAKHGLEVTYKPMGLMSVFGETGGIPPAKRHPSRQAIRWLELQRWRDQRGVELNLKPKFWPFDFSKADRLVVAIIQAGHNPEKFISAGTHALWVEERDLADDATLIGLADSAGLPGAQLVKQAANDEIGQLYEGLTRQAIEAGVFGSPTVVLDGEVFWGQDRYDQLDAALASGREAYRSL
ncbi:MAG: 2-hydroxychromene-2-carboxylate isomerase [Alphaproteobacteria bacterium]